MVLELQKRLGGAICAVLKQKYGLTVESVPLETPPDLRLGEIATPIALQLARTLRKAPKVIAQEIVTALGQVEGFAGFEVAGAGYINARLDRGAFVKDAAFPARRQKPAIFANVEHTSINPNKAAHIGHLRNAVLGDTWARLLKAESSSPDTVIVQNYIDNTGVQVADVVVGFLHLEKKTVAEVRQLVADCEKRAEASGRPADAIDYYCWDLYARTSQWYGEGTDKEKAARKQLRLDTLHAIEHGGNETAEIADLISTAVLRRHLETMLRLGIEYDFLPRESEILHLKFWDAAFAKLKESGVLYKETQGKNAGCWVMTRPGAETAEGEADEDAKVIVRSNGTVTYVGKDIAYHLWKFHLLEGCEFGDEVFYTYPDGRQCYRSIDNRSVDANGTPYGTGVPVHFKASGADYVFNVIDARQSDAQANVKEALRGMGYVTQADQLRHFTYEMVALTPRCAEELGYAISDEDKEKPYIEVSGRKGFGVKADDLIDKLIAAARAEVDARQAGRGEAERQRIAAQIAIGALRYFMLKVTRNSVIAFDFKDALSFEGETGPYIQYAVVRIRNILRKCEAAAEAVLTEFSALDKGCVARFLSGSENEDIWALWLRAGRRSLVLEQCIAGSEPAFLAKHAFQLAQEFNNFYHRHHILTEEDPERKKFLLATAAVVLRELLIALDWLGIEGPEAM